MALRSVGARWNKSTKTWSLPLDTDLAGLSGALTLVWADDVVDWVQQQRQTRAKLVRLHKAKDTKIVFGDGLDSYQRVGVRFLTEAKRAILADDVGLGKTAQALRAALEVDAKRVLVITRKSLLYNWLHEVHKWAVDTSVDVLLSIDDTLPNTRFVLTNYEAATKHLKLLQEVSWDALLVDEAHYVKNRKTQRTKTIAKLARSASYVWLLTATPMLNGVWELWSLLNIIRPDVYTSFWRFVDNYCWTEPNFFGGRDFLPGIKNEVAFQREVAPLVLRRTKGILKLPPLSYETIHVPLGEEQQRIYEELKTHFLALVDDDHYVMTPTVLSQLTRLRQVSCSPALIGGKDHSKKTEAFLDLLEDYTPKHKVLAFTTFAEYAKLLLPHLEKYGGKAILGEQSHKERFESEQTFQKDPDCRVLIGTIGAMGEGLNLQAADIVVFLNKDWTPARNEVQAVGRAHRRGQTKPVHVISLVTANSVEEHVENVLQDKKTTSQVFEAVVKRLQKEKGSV